MKACLLPCFLLTLAFASGACSGVASLEDERPSLAPQERQVVVSKSNEAFQKGQWKSAWDEAVRAGASREQLEQIAIETFAPQDPVRTPADPSTAADMFGALRGKYGALTAAARSRIVARRDEYVAAHRWMQALELELGAADDPPKYAGAWKVYEASPPWKSSAIADRIEEARTDYQAEQAEAAAGRDG